MKLTDSSGQDLSEVLIGLTLDEARELQDALKASVSNPGAAGHQHVSSSDYATEIRVWVMVEDDPGLHPDLK